MHPRIEAITRRAIGSLAPKEPAPVAQSVNELFQFEGGMPVEIRIAEQADQITKDVEDARYGRAFIDPSQVALSHLVAELALDAGLSPALSRRRGSNTFDTQVSLNQFALRHIYVSPSTTTTERGIALPEGIMAVTQIRSRKDKTLEQTIVAAWTNPKDVENNGTIYTGFHLQISDHVDYDTIKVLQCSIDPDSKTTLMRVSSPTDGYHDYRFRLQQSYFALDGEYLATIDNGTNTTSY